MDPAAEVERRTKAAREFLLKEFESIDEPGDKILYPPRVMAELGAHGRYALPALIEFLSSDHSNDAFYFLTHVYILDMG